MCENGGTFVNLFHIDTHSLASDGLELREAKGTTIVLHVDILFVAVIWKLTEKKIGQT